MDPRHMHEFDRNKKGLCKTIIGSEICHQPEHAAVHERQRNAAAEEREELLAEIARLRGALSAVKRVAKMNLSFTPEYMLN